MFSLHQYHPLLHFHFGSRQVHELYVWLGGCLQRRNYRCPGIRRGVLLLRHGQGGMRTGLCQNVKSKNNFIIYTLCTCLSSSQFARESLIQFFFPICFPSIPPVLALPLLDVTQRKPPSNNVFLATGWWNGTNGTTRHGTERRQQGQEEVTREQFADLWKEFFSTEDENAPGNFIFGNLKF